MSDLHSAAVPLSWRKVAPLHRSYGARSLRYSFIGGNGMPLTASPLILNNKFTAGQIMDRIIGFNLSIQASAVSTNLYMQELNTGWQFSYTYPGVKGVYIMGNIETLPDEINLSVAFDTQISGNIYLAFYNFEIVPMAIS